MRMQCGFHDVYTVQRPYPYPYPYFGRSEYVQWKPGGARESPQPAAGCFHTFLNMGGEKTSISWTRKTASMTGFCVNAMGKPANPLSSAGPQHNKNCICLFVYYGLLFNVIHKGYIIHFGFHLDVLVFNQSDTCTLNINLDMSEICPGLCF